MYCHEASTFCMPTGTDPRLDAWFDSRITLIRKCDFHKFLFETFVVLEFSNFKHIFGNAGLSTRKEIN